MLDENEIRDMEREMQRKEDAEIDGKDDVRRAIRRQPHKSMADLNIEKLFGYDCDKEQEG